MMRLSDSDNRSATLSPYSNLTADPGRMSLERQGTFKTHPVGFGNTCLWGGRENLPASLKFFVERGPGVIFFVALFWGFLAAAEYDGPAPDP